MSQMNWKEGYPQNSDDFWNFSADPNTEYYELVSFTEEINEDDDYYIPEQEEIEPALIETYWNLLHKE